VPSRPSPASGSVGSSVAEDPRAIARRTSTMQGFRNGLLT
jgi:hypothetical protein